jgi:tyrosyl-tRNA synthetase
MNFIEELQYRGLVKDVTDYDALVERLKNPVTIYCGFDPTGDSLHVGHLQQVILLKRYQMQGHRPIALCGGATGMIGDPRPTTERSLLSAQQIAYNVACLTKQLSQFLDFTGDFGALMVNNYDWISQLNIIDFLRDYGKYFSVSYMLNKDVVASRLAGGISFTEFTYTILQAIDFLHLYRTYSCEIQIGGSDQWGNLTSGVELIRKMEGPNAKVFGITSPLITKSDGSKFGKSEGQNVWLDPSKTNAYEFYQFWLNTPDSDVIDYLKRLSFYSVSEIEDFALQVANEAHLRAAQKALAQEMTVMVHGEVGYQLALKVSQTLFGGDFTTLNQDELQVALKGLAEYIINDDKLLVDLMVESKIASSKREAREWISNGSISINGVKVKDLEMVVTAPQALFGQWTIIRRGKKNYYVIKHQ